jgi:hypothetical protein
VPHHRTALPPGSGRLWGLRPERGLVSFHQRLKPIKNQITACEVLSPRRFSWRAHSCVPRRRHPLDARAPTESPADYGSLLALGCGHAVPRGKRPVCPRENVPQSATPGLLPVLLSLHLPCSPARTKIPGSPGGGHAASHRGCRACDDFRGARIVNGAYQDEPPLALDPLMPGRKPTCRY